MGKPTFDSWNSKISILTIEGFGVRTVMFENHAFIPKGMRFWISSYQVKV
jgi:hypothetical protein